MTTTGAVAHGRARAADDVSARQIFGSIKLGLSEHVRYASDPLCRIFEGDLVPGGGRPTRALVYARLEEAVDDLRSRLGGLPSPVEAEDVWDAIWYAEAHHSTALEGNTLVLEQVRRLLHDGRAVGDKELKEYLEVQGYADAARWVYRHALEPREDSGGLLVTVQEVRAVHHRAITPVWEVAPHPQAGPEESPGSWRRHDIAPFPAGMRPPAHLDVDAAVHDWVAAANRLADDDATPLPERLAALHCTFEQVHPFLDGNGRAGRLLLNLVLVRLGYPPAVVYKRQRETYLRALRRADAGEHGLLGELLARAVTDSLYRFVVPAVAGPARLVPLASLTDRARGLSGDVLRTAANRGRLRAQQTPEGRWLSTGRWVDEYAATRHRRG